MEEHDTPWQSAVAALRHLYSADGPERTELEWAICPDDPPQGHGGGYVVDCLRSARWAVEQGPYETAVRAAISLGHDTDTTAAVAGGIAGIRDGIEAIPPRWRTGLRGQAEVAPLLERLLTHHGET